jgi:hypothetical protein
MNEALIVGRDLGRQKSRKINNNLKGEKNAYHKEKRIS